MVTAILMGLAALMGLASLAGLSVFEKVSDVFRRRDKGKVTTFRELVFTLADGKARQPSAEQIARTLEETGHDLDELRRCVERRHARAELLSVVKDADGCARELAEVEQAAAAANRELETAQAKHGGIMADLRARQQAAESRARAAESARQKLITECDDPVTIEKREDLDRRRQEVQGRVAALAPGWKDRVDWMHKMESTVGSSTHTRLCESNRATQTADLASAQAAVEGDRQEEAALRREMAALDAEAARLDAAAAQTP